MIKVSDLPKEVDITSRAQVKKLLGFPMNCMVLCFKQETREQIIESDSVYKLDDTTFFLTRKQDQGIVYGTLASFVLNKKKIKEWENVK